jgi:hypothetical protein
VLADPRPSGAPSSLGIVAEEVVAARECTRDDDSAIVKVTVLDVPGAGDVAFLAERDNGDAVRLRQALSSLLLTL